MYRIKRIEKQNLFFSKFIVLVSLLLVLCVSHAKAYEEVDDSQFVDDGGEDEYYYSFYVPSGRDANDLDHFKVFLRGKVSDKEDTLPVWEIQSNYSGKYEKIGDINTDSNYWYRKTYHVTNGTHKYLIDDRYVKFGARSLHENLDDSNVHVETVAVSWYFRYPSLWVSTSSLDFGNLYDSDRDGAEEYNNKQTKKLRVKNNGDPETNLVWEITDVPSSVNVSSLSGRLSQGSEEEITVWVNSDSTGNFSGSFKVNDTTISLSANVYDAPDKVTFQNAKGSNNKINIGPNSKVRLEVKSGNPSFPSASIKEYEWQDVRGDSSPDANKWTSSSGNEKDFLFSQSVEYTIYCRMVDDNGVATSPASIPLRVWNAPKITEGAGDSWYGMGEYFVSVRNQPLFLQAKTDLNGNKSIVKYEWKRDDKVIAISPGSQGLACVIYPVLSSEVSSYNLNNFENYVKNNNISPRYSWTFDTVNFPNSGTFKHADQTDADGNVVDTGIANYFLAQFSGFLKITTAGNYTFYVKSDEGFRLRINNELIAQHSNTRSFGETSGSYNFPSPGTYSIDLTYFDASGGQGLELRWDPPSGGKAIIPKSAFGAGGSYIFERPNLSGRITCKAFTNYGIESKKESFPVKIYDLLEVDITGETTGSPNRSVVFEAEIPDRNEKYPGYLSVSYDWTISGEPELVKAENKVEAKWNVIGDFNAAVTANLSTKEGLSLSATSKKIVISISPAKPTAFPDGPYKGGIVGGNYSPIQFLGNDPDYIEAPEIGKIKTWEWNFLCPSGGSLDFDGEDDYCYNTNSFGWTPTAFSVSWWFNPNKSKTAHGDIPGMPGSVYTGSQSIGAGDYPAWGAFQFGITANGAVVIGTDTATAFNKDDLPDGTAEFNKWQHFTFTYESEENASVGTGKFYKNGVKLAEKADMAIPTQWNGFWIGSSKKANTVYGKVDDVAIWKRAIDPGEVSKFIGKSPENELDCLAFWDFNDNTQYGADVIGRDNDLTLSGGPLWLDSGRSVFGSRGNIRGGALRFDGNNDYVKLDTTPFTSSPDFTIALWASPDVIGDGGLISGDRLPSLRMTSGGGLYYSSYQSGGSRYDGTISNFFSEAEKWVHIAWVKSGTSYKFYLNGELQDTKSAPSSFDYSSSTYYIGKDGNYSWDGNIDEVCIFNRALSNGDPSDKTDDEIVAIGTNPREFAENLVLYYDCEQGSSLTLLDQSDLGKNGLLYNGTNWLSFNEASNQYNATFAYSKAGTYTAVLRVRTEYDKWSDVKNTEVTVIDGGLSGLVKAADLRTPVKDVQMTLMSSHVDPDVLASIADENTSLFTTGNGGIYTWTDETGYFSIEHLPLGNYRLTASKVENEKAHEFENPVQTVELTLESPNKHGFLYTDISVFPVSGRIVYSLQKNEQDVFVKNAVVTAQPTGKASPIKALKSEKSPDATGSNYNLPLFAGRYMFIAERGAHDIRLNENSTGYDKDSGLVTIANAVTDIDFIDYTTRELTVYVEDSGGFPIDTYQDNKIKVQVNGENGFVEDEVVTENKTYLRVTVPPGKYTVSLPNVPTAYVKGKTSEKKADVILESEEPQPVTMVVPVPITLAISNEPHLLDLMPEEFLEKIGLTDADDPEGYMIYFPPEIQTHTYTITATANGKPVEDFTLKVTDDISQLNTSPASEKTYPGQPDGKYETDSDGNGLYQISAGWPNRTIVDPDNPDTYLEYTLPDSSIVKVPIVLPKKIKFQANKDGYEESPIYTKEVTVLGDVSEGSEAVPVAVPNVNYFVLHDPPGDASYSYIDDSMSIRGILTDVTMRLNDTEIPVYPSPWSVERDIDDVDFDNIKESGQDLGNKGLLGYRDSDPTAGHFSWAAALEFAVGQAIMATGPLGFALHLAKVGSTVAGLAGGQTIQYEVRPNRYIKTPGAIQTPDVIPDLNGPGKGDIYYGEGWTLALQTKYRLGIKKNPNYDSQNPDSQEWIPDTAQILTYDIMERNNQYVYTVRDIVDIIAELEAQVTAIGDPGDDPTKKNEKDRLKSAISTWKNLLTKNLAYMWQKDYIKSDVDGKEANRANLEDFFKSNFSDQDSELLIFSGRSSFKYSRTISEKHLTQFSTSISVATNAQGETEWSTGPFGGGGGLVGLIVKTEMALGGKVQSRITTSQNFGASWESGTVSEQSVGFVLADNDEGDNISTYVFEGPWGTPIFFTDPGSVTSDPWQAGTNKAVDVNLELLSNENWGPFDYHDGAHYQFKVSSVGRRKLEGAGIDFLFYDPPLSNSKSATVNFNGSGEAPYKIKLFKDFVATDLTNQINPSDGISLPSATIMVSIYPPENDWKNSQEVEYPVLVQSEEAADYQIAVNKMLRPKFADLRSPRATITAPYDGQRISPAVFTDDDKFKIEAFSDDHDVAKIQIEYRSKRTDGVWAPWASLSGMVCEVEQVANLPNVTMVVHSSRDPVRREFTFDWSGSEIENLGVGEYSLRAVAEDKATRLNVDGVTQEAHPNVDLDAPIVKFQVDGSKPTVLTTTPFYQDKESERIYRGELSVTFNDDMRATDFSDRTFEVTDLLRDKVRVAGFVSYSPALRKTLFVPQVPFKPNGFYFVTIKTDEEQDDGTIDRGVHDLAGNPLDNEFTMTFRTKDTPFEEQWSIVLSARSLGTSATGTSTDANNIAAVEFGAEDGVDDRDAHAVPNISTQFNLSFLNSDQVELDRDVRPADGRLSHHWFFAISNPQGDVTISYQPSAKLAKTPDLRQYKVLRLIEFAENGSISNTIALTPKDSELNTDTGKFTTLEPYTYTPADGETVRHFRLDVMKASFVATTLEKGTTAWRFFSAPITPTVADPFVNLGDDIEPFKLYRYDTALNGYKVYPLDIGEVSLITGHGYFLRLEKDVIVDIGGAANNNDIEIELDNVGWHAIGNPFIKPVNVAELLVNGSTFSDAATNGVIQGTLYHWNANPASGTDAYEIVDNTGQLNPWEGYWLKTLSDNLTLTVPAPLGLGTFVPLLPDSYQPPMAPPQDLAGFGSAEQKHTNGEFELKFALTSDFASDTITVLGTRQNAKAGKDLLDQEEPPILKGTVAAYFENNRDDHSTSGDLYNTDYQPSLAIGETRTWELVVYASKPNAKMRLSWEDAIGQVPDDVMLTLEHGSLGKSRLQDMRQVQSVELDTQQFITKEIFEIRAERFEMALPKDLSIIAGEAQVKIKWAANDNPFITGYTILKWKGESGKGKDGLSYAIRNTQHDFMDTDVEEETTYTYQISVHFKTGAELKSELFTVTVLPVIEKTVLLQSYPNPFNPETWIPYDLDRECGVVFEIYNVNGQIVRKLDLGVQPRGRYISKGKAAYWDGRNELGERVAGGVYFYVLKADDFVSTKKMVILK